MPMKMVILEVAGNYAAALSDDGRISRIPNRDYRVGQTLLCPSRDKKRRISVYVKQLAAVAAVFVLLLAGAGVVLKMPVTYVSLDVNPSVEYKLNMLDQVVEVVTINEEAKELLKDTTLVNRSAEKAIKQTVELLGKNNYLKMEQKNDIVISSTSTVSGKSKSVLNTVTKATKEATASISVKADIIAYEGSMSELKKAEKLDTTPGKMLLVNQIVETDVQTDDMTEEQANEVQTYLQMPVAELVSVISQDGLTQLSEQNDSVRYIQTDPVMTADDPNAVDSSSQTSEQASSDETSSDVSQADTSSEESSSDTETSSVILDPTVIPPVNPGVTTSETEDTTSSNEQENTLVDPNESTSEEPNSQEIPDIKPGINPDETSDVTSQVESEFSPDLPSAIVIGIDEIYHTDPDQTDSETVSSSDLLQ